MTSTALAKLDSPSNMRRQAAAIATLQLISDSCFLSSEAHRHEKCFLAAKALAESDTIEEIKEAIYANKNNFVLQFYCRGAEYQCSCGEMVPNGARACSSCGQIIENPSGFLAIPQWETRLTLAAFEVAVATDIQVGNFLSHSIHRTTRLIVLRNLLNQSERDHYEKRATEIRNELLDRWPEEMRPGPHSWQFRFIRYSAIFWLVAWPMLSKSFDLDTADKVFSIRLIKAAAISSVKWKNAEANPETYAKTVKAILSMNDLNQEAAIMGLSPKDTEEEDVAVNGNEESKKAWVLHPPELLSRGKIFRTTSKYWIAIPLEEQEVSVLEDRYQVAELGYSELIEELERDEDA